MATKVAPICPISDGFYERSLQVSMKVADITCGSFRDRENQRQFWPMSAAVGPMRPIFVGQKNDACATNRHLREPVSTQSPLARVPAQIAEARKLWHEWKITKPVNR
jgi:hypothetical protein